MLDSFGPISGDEPLSFHAKGTLGKLGQDLNDQPIHRVFQTDIFQLKELTQKETLKSEKPEIKPIAPKDKIPEKEKKRIYFGKKKEEKVTQETKPIKLKEKEPKQIKEKIKPKEKKHIHFGKKKEIIKTEKKEEIKKLEKKKPKLVFGTKKELKEKAIEEKKPEKEKTKEETKEKTEEKEQEKTEKEETTEEKQEKEQVKEKTDEKTEVTEEPPQKPLEPLEMKFGDENSDYIVLWESKLEEVASEGKVKLKLGEPFAGFKDFAHCVSENQDKDNPEAYCGKVKHQVEGEMLM